MPSAQEMRYWIVLGVLLLWATLALALYDQLTWAPGGSPQEALRQVQRTTGRLSWSSLVGMGFGVLMVTRLAYCVLRAHLGTAAGTTEPESSAHG